MDLKYEREKRESLKKDLILARESWSGLILHSSSPFFLYFSFPSVFFFSFSFSFIKSSISSYILRAVCCLPAIRTIRKMSCHPKNRLCKTYKCIFFIFLVDEKVTFSICYIKKKKLHWYNFFYYIQAYFRRNLSRNYSDYELHFKDSLYKLTWTLYKNGPLHRTVFPSFGLERKREKKLRQK